MTHALKRAVSYDISHILGCIATMLLAPSTAEYPAEILSLTPHFLALSGWANKGSLQLIMHCCLLLLIQIVG